MEQKFADTTSNKELSLIVSDLQSGLDDLGQNVATINSQIGQLQTVQQFQVTPQAVNQIYNGSFTHSENSWNNSAAANTLRYECHNWFSHPTIDGQEMLPVYGITLNTFLFAPVNITLGPPSTIQVTTPGFATGTAIQITPNVGTLPAPLALATTYYIIRVNNTTIKLADTAAHAVAGTSINLTTTGGGGAAVFAATFTYALKTPDDTYYSAAFTDWSWTSPSAGSARFQSSTSLDAIVPGNNIEPGYTYYGSFDIVKASQYVTAAGEERIWCGLYAKQSGTWDWIKGAFEIDATVLGTVATPTSRDYRILCETDRGFSVLSDVVTVAGAPGTLDFDAGARVFLQWKNVLVYGVQTYKIYRLTGATYVLLQTITTGLTQTLDNGASEAAAAGWPTGDFSSLVAYTATIPDVIDSLPYVGDPINTSWATIPFTLKVPQNYDMSATSLSASDKQWLRWGFSNLTGNLDLRMTDGVTVIGDHTLDSPAGQFTADQVGLSVTLQVPGNDTVQATTIASYTSTTSVELADAAVFDSSELIIYITAGAPAHSIFVDLAHLTYIQGSAFMPAAEDISPSRGYPPVKPNGTTQGGSGVGQQGGTIDGQPVCLYEEEEVETKDGIVFARDLRQGMKLPDGYGSLNTIWEMKYGVADVYYLETANGCSLKATLTKQIFTSNGKKTLDKLQKGDMILTMLGGILQESPIFIKELLLKKQVVVQIGLKPTESFLAGGGAGRILVSNNKAIQGGGDFNPLGNA